MSPSSIQSNEEDRLAELRRFDILDTPPEQAFDHIVDIAADLLQAPIALISLVDRDRIWFKARHGMEAKESAKHPGFCADAILSDGIYEVRDTLGDPRTRSNPLVTHGPHIRFYAAAPLRSSRGFNIGALCILDTSPRQLSEPERKHLLSLAALASDLIEARAASHALRKSSSDHSRGGGKAGLQSLLMGGPTVVFRWKAAEGWPVEYVSPNVAQFGYPPQDLAGGKIPYAQIVHPDDLNRVAAEVELYSRSGVECFEQEYRILCADKRVVWVYDFTVVVRNAGGKVTHYNGYLLDITARKNAETAQRDATAQYEAMVEGFDGLVYICSQDYKVEFMNRRLIERTGYNAVGQDCFRALHDRSDICPWCVNESVSQGKMVRWEVQSPKDSRWYYVVNTPLARSDGRVSKMSMIQDVTERKFSEETLKRREAILEAVGFASEKFMKTAGWQKVVQEVLARLGRATGVSRIYVCENAPLADGRLASSRRFEWVAQGVAPQIYSREAQDFPWKAGPFRRWEESLQRGHVVDGSVQEFPACERAVLQPQSVRSLVAVPIFVEQRWWGYLGFDECASDRTWVPAEIDALKTAASLLGAAIERAHAEEALRRSEEGHRVLLRALPDLIFRIRKDGTVLDVKAEDPELLVAPPDQIIGKRLDVLLPPAVAQQGLQYIHRALETGTRQVYEYELALQGRKRQFESRMVPSGKDEVLSIVRDITERKESEGELRKLSSAVEQSADCVIITDAKGVIEYVNPAFEKLTGYSRSDAMGRTPALLKSGRHDNTFYQKLWKRLRAGEIVSAEFINRKKQGDLYYHGVTMMPIRSEAGTVTHYVATGRDISERVAAVEALRESERRLGDIISFLPDPTFVIDRQGSVIAWNRAVEEMTGVTAQDMLGKGNYEYALPFYGQRRPVLADLVLKPDKAYEKEYRYVERVKDTLIAEVELTALRAEPVHVWVKATPLYDANGNVAGAIESVRDITERKQSEEAIRKLATFPQFNPNAVLEFAADGALAYFNKAAKEMAVSLGRENPMDIVPPDTVSIVQQCLSTRHKRQRVEVSMGHRTLSWSFFPIAETRSVHAYGTDITDRLAMESQMRHLQKMEAVGRLAGGVAHDFNNILTAILGYASMLLLEKDLEPGVIEQVREISNAAERASELTRQLLTFSRKQVIQPKPLDLNEVLTSLTNMLRRLIAEDITLRVSTHPKLPRIRGDQSMIDQLLVNLVINARDAMPQGGQIVISTSVSEITNEQAESNPEARSGRFVCLTVTDTGCGIRKDQQAQIFEPFFTTKEGGKGTGLGLATVYGVVKQHQGWIEVVSEENKGAIFNIFLPVYAGTAPAPAKPPPPPLARGGKETILIVEDEPSVRALASAVLAQYGYEVIEASSGAEGLAVWRKHAGPIHLLLADVVMPGGMTGGELAEQLLVLKKDLKVILTSGYHRESLIQKFAVRDGVKFLPKPFSPDGLARLVRESLDG